MREWTPEQCDKALKMYDDPDVTYEMIGRVLGGISPAAARGRIRRLLGSDFSYAQGEDEKDVSGTGTVSEIMDDHGLDPDEWKAERVTITNDKTWVKFTRKVDPYLADTLSQIEEAKQMMLEAAPSWESVRPVDRDTDIMAEISIPDPHFGMLAWGEETMGKNRDTKIAQQEYAYVVEKLLLRTGVVDEYLYVIGNDTFHSDQSVPGSNAGGATTRGTIQDVDTRPRKVFRAVTQVKLATVQKMLDRGAKVKILVCEGNHDRNVSFYLGEVLHGWYHDHPNVEVINDPTQRKYYQYGNVLLGYTHGDNEKPDDLPLIMAQEAPRQWSETVYREWHLGHLHKKRRGLTMSGEEYHGVRVRWMPSIAPRDAWHASKGYMHQLSAEALKWHPVEGNVGSAIVNLGVG